MKSVLKQALSVLLVILISVIKVNAQETTAEIQGLITVGNAGIAGANITAIHQPTGTKYVTTSRNDGRYNLSNLKIGGPYLLEVTYVGMKTEKQEDINLLIGQAFRANFKLVEASSSLKEVVVSSTKQDKTFNNSRTGSQETFNRAAIAAIPTVTRSWKDIVKLVPTANGLSFGGQSAQLNNVTIDGANFNNSFGLGDGTIGGQTNQTALSLDAVEQIQVNTTPFDVRQGGFTGGGINTVTRSGGNKFVGSVYEYIKNQDLQGYEVNAPYTFKVAKTPFEYTLKGFTIGGALIKNKLFFFINGETEFKSNPATSWQASDATHPADAVNYSVANADSLAALASFLKQNYNYDPGAFQGYSYITESKRFSVKLDWNINTNNTFTFKFNMLRSANQNQPSSRGPGTNGLPFYGAGYGIHNDVNTFLGELNSRLSSSMNNKLQIGYTALRDYRNFHNATPFPMVDIYQNGNLYTTFGNELFSYGNKLNTDVYQLNDILNIYKGKHEFTIGVQASYKRYINGFSPNYQGTYRFNSLQEFYNSAASGSTQKATTYALSYTQPGDPFPFVGPKDFEAGFFAQDKYRVTDKLTLTYGVRFDYTKLYNNFIYNPVVDTLQRFYNGTHLNTGVAPAAVVQISPRFGFNYDVFADQTFQIRGGVGLFQGAPPFVWISNQSSNAGMPGPNFGSISSGSSSTNGSSSYVFSPNPNAYRPTVNSGLFNSYNINVTDPNFKFPQVFKSTLAADKKLGNGWVVTAEGTYTKNFNAPAFQNVALPSSGLIRLTDGRYRFVNTPGNTTAVQYPLGGSKSITNPAIAQAIYLTNVNAGYAWTGTLQVSKTSKHLNFSAAYTRQEAYDALVFGSTASTMFYAREVVGNPNEISAGRSANYLPHRIIATLRYQKEFVKNTLTSIGLLYEGAPNYATSYTVSGDLNNDGSGSTNNDLMFIPADASQIKFTQSKSVNGVADTRSVTDIWNQFNDFIKNSPYLNARRGQFAERNGFVLPWTHRLDLNFTQDFIIKVKDNKHTLRLTADIYNFSNLINKDWGVLYSPTTTRPLTFSAMDTDGKTPIYQFNYLDGVNKVPFTKPTTPSTSIGSRWQLQIGVRYLFN
jgi:hypothetical protein